MEYRTLTGTGATVSRAALGTMTFGRETDEADSIRMVDMALDAGINWIDTADLYSDFRSEEIVGKALKGRRRDVVLATKAGFPGGPNPRRDAGLNRWHLIDGLNNSLRRLQTDYVDIFYLHLPDHTCPIEETLAAMDHLVGQGKVIYAGMSNFPAWKVSEAAHLCRGNGWASPVVLQSVWNLLTRGLEDELLPCLDHYNIGLTIYNPLAGGLLTGKHTFAAAPAANTRFSEVDTYFGRYWTERNFQAIDILKDVADHAGMSLIELSFRWLVSHQQIDAILVGSRSLGHFQSNVEAIEKGGLDDDLVAACDAAWAHIRGDYFQYFY